MVEMAGITETYHLAQFERVHPEHGGAEVVAQPHSFKSSALGKLSCPVVSNAVNLEVC